MADTSQVNTNFWVTAKEGFSTTTSGTVTSGASTVGLNSVAGYSNGDIVALVIEPLSTTGAKQVFTGVIDTTGVQVTGVKWTEGTNQTHNAGVSVVDYETATAWALYAKGIKLFANNDATLKTSAVQAALGISGTTPPDYTLLSAAPASVTYNGNRSYSMVFNTVDYTPTLQPGTRLRSTRTVTAPTQSTLLNGSSQYWNRTATNNGFSFTAAWVVGAYIKLTSYPSGSAGTIISKTDGTNGWTLRILNTGQVQAIGFNAASGNNKTLVSTQSIPLNKWVHVIVQQDMSTTTNSATANYCMIDGYDVPVNVTGNGTNPTAIVQGGNLSVGMDSSFYFPGKVAQAFVAGSKITQATIRTLSGQSLTSALITANSIVSAFDFNNNSNDLNTTNANNLSANGSAVATNADSPFGNQGNGTISATLDYGIVQSVSFSTNTTVVVQAAEGCTFPTSGGISSINYSSMKSPFGFPAQKEKWEIIVVSRTDITVTATYTADQYYYSGISITPPIGSWSFNSRPVVRIDAGAGNIRGVGAALDTSSGNFGTDLELTDTTAINNSTNSGGSLRLTANKTFTTATPYYLNIRGINTSGNQLYLLGSPAPSILKIENSLL